MLLKHQYLKSRTAACEVNTRGEWLGKISDEQREEAFAVDLSASMPTFREIRDG